MELQFGVIPDQAKGGNGDKRRMRCDVMKWFQLVILASMGCCSTTVFAAEGDVATTALLEASKKADGDGALVSTLFIRYLSTVHGDSTDEKTLFAACIEQVQESGNDGNLGAIEDLLNSERYLSQPNSPTRRLIAELRASASEAWYEVKWKTADVQEKTTTALYGCHPAPPVHVDVDVSRKRLSSLGDSGRAAFIAMLMNPELRYERSLWVTLASSSATSLITQSPFDASDDHWNLTAKEENDVLQQGGSYGKAVVIRSLLQSVDARGIKAMIDWIKIFSDKPWAVNSLLQDVKSLGKADSVTKQLFVQSVVRFAGRAQIELKNTVHGLPDSEWAASLYLVNHKLASMQSFDEAKRYFEDYRRFRKELNLSFLNDANDQYRSSVTGSLKYADRFAGLSE